MIWSREKTAIDRMALRGPWFSSHYSKNVSPFLFSNFQLLHKFSLFKNLLGKIFATTSSVKMLIINLDNNSNKMRPPAVPYLGNLPSYALSRFKKVFWKIYNFLAPLWNTFFSKSLNYEHENFQQTQRNYACSKHC